MFCTNAFLAIALVSAFCTAPPAGPAAPQAPAPQASKAEVLSIKVWSCPEHQQFRMTGKGACPACGKDLVQKEIAVSGPGAAGDPYPLDTCAVCGLTLGKDLVVMLHEGREVRFCGKDCIKKFQAEPAKYLEQVDQKIISQQIARYPMTTCPVSGEALGEMGEPASQVYNNRLVRFCCKMCVRKFKQTPAEYLSKLDQAVVAQQKASYPLATCMVSGQKLGGMGEPVDYVVAGHLVRFCCPGCLAGFYKNPADYLAKLDKAWGDKSAPAPAGAKPG
jgi:YHS domain-containing protein